MKVKGFLNIRANGTARFTKTNVALHVDEISMAIEIKVPDALFEKPKLQATIEIPDSVAIPELINSEVVDNINELVKVNTGLDLNITIVEHEAD